MKRCAIYARISEDAEGKGLGVARQIKDCQHLIDQRGWVVAGEPYVDNDVSATRSKTRPEYERLLRDIEAGRVDAVVVWALDRLHRRPVELEHFIALVEKHEVALANVAGDVDLSTDMGQMMARVMGAVAAQEARAISRRVRSKQAELREEGKPFSGGIRAYGWQADRITPIPEEQVEIRRMVEWVLSGRSVASLVRDLNERRVQTVSQWMHANPTPRGHGRVQPKPWTLTSVRAVLSRPRIAGLLTYRGEIVGEGAWEPVIDRVTFDRLQAALSAKSRRFRAATNARRYLLSGIAECGACGTPLQVGAAADGKESLRRYRCPVAASGRAKGTGVRHGGRNMVHLDGHVIEGLLDVLELSRLHPDDEVEVVDPGPEIEELRRRLNTAADQFAEGVLDAEQLQRISTTLRLKISELEARRPAPAAETLMDWYLGSTDRNEARAAFLGLPLEQRRRILVEQLGERGYVKVYPARQFNPGGLGGLDTSTIDVLWSKGPAPVDVPEPSRQPVEPTGADLAELDRSTSAAR